MTRTVTAICALVPFAVGVAAFSISPPVGLTRTDLQRHDISIEGHEAIQTQVDFAPGAVAPWHSHPGEELVYVPEGELEFPLEGEKPVTLKATLDTLFAQRGTGSGIGKTLLEAVMNDFVQGGYKMMLVWVLEQNPVVGFYETMSAQHITSKAIEIATFSYPKLLFVWLDLIANSPPDQSY